MAKHILCIAFPGYGHLIPLLEFAKKLSSYYKVSFAVSKSQINDLRERGILFSETLRRIPVIPIHDGAPDGMKESTGLWEMRFTDIHPSVTKFVKGVSYQSVDDATETGILPVDVIVTDVFFSAPLAAVENLHIPYYLFETSSAQFFCDKLFITEETPVGNSEHKRGSLREIPVELRKTLSPVSRIVQEQSTAYKSVSSIRKRIDYKFIQRYRRGSYKRNPDRSSFSPL